MIGEKTLKKTDILYLIIIMLSIAVFANSLLKPEPVVLPEMTPGGDLSSSINPSNDKADDGYDVNMPIDDSVIIEDSGNDSADDGVGALDGSTIQASTEPTINARSAIVMDFDTGTILYEKNAYRKRPMASTTKIMTGIVAIENCSLDEDVTISEKAGHMGGSVMGIKTGTTIKMRDLLYGMLICSGNDAAVAIAEHVGGSIEGFSELMNKKALELGAFSTSFSNPHGLDAENHYTTAYDLAKITRYALKMDIFNDIVKTSEFTYNGRTFRNTNEMLLGYEGADGVKTGYTGRAGRCLVTSVTKNNMRIISVVLFCDTKNLRTSSSRRILDYGFEEYGPVTLLEHGNAMGMVKVDRSRTSQEIHVAVSEELKTILRHGQKDMLYTRVSLPEAVTAPVKRGTIMGTVSIFQGEKIIAETSLIALDSAEKMKLSNYLSNVVNQWIKLIH